MCNGIAFELFFRAVSAVVGVSKEEQFEEIALFLRKFSATQIGDCTRDSEAVLLL